MFLEVFLSWKNRSQWTNSRVKRFTFKPLLKSSFWRGTDITQTNTQIYIVFYMVDIVRKMPWRSWQCKFWGMSSLKRGLVSKLCPSRCWKKWPIMPQISTTRTVCVERILSSDQPCFVQCLFKFSPPSCHRRAVPSFSPMCFHFCFPPPSI